MQKGKYILSFDTLLSVGNDGMVEIDKNAITMETLTSESLKDKITTSDLSELENIEQQDLVSKTNDKGESRDD